MKKEDNINAILDTGSHHLLNGLADFFKIVYGVEWFKFCDDHKQDGEGNFSIGFWYKKFNEDEKKWSYVKLHTGEINIGIKCGKCGSERLRGYNASGKYVYCQDCNTKLFDYEFKGLIFF